MNITTDHPAQPRLVARVLRLGSGTFGPASEEPYRRRARDAVRLGISVVVLVALARRVGDVGPTEQSVFQFFNTLPSGLESLFTTLYRLGALWAVVLVAAAALLGRRWRLARDLALSGVLAWAIARAVGVFVVEDKSFGKSIDLVTRLGNTPSFPLVRLAVVVAIVEAAAPYVSRPTRRIGAVVVVALALSAMYLGTSYPNDLIAAAVIGWGVAAGVHFGFGSPGGRPTSAQVAASLAQLGIDARDVRLAHEQPQGSTLMLARDSHGPLSVKVIGRDEADAQMIAKIWRFFAYKDSGPTLFLTRLQQVEHEAYALLLARTGRVRVPRVVIAGTAGPNAAIVVARPLIGPLLSEMPRKEVTDKLLEELWVQVGRLHDARVVHGGLNTARVVATADGPGIFDFGASSAWTPERAGDDLAELLGSTAAIVGERRAVQAVIRGIGPDAVRDALPYLQPAAFSERTRDLAAPRGKKLSAQLARLRTVAAHAIGTDVPELHELHRVKPANLLMAVGTLVGAGALLGQVGDPAHVWNSLRHADVLWVITAFVLSMATNIGLAIALMGTVNVRLPFWRTTEVQAAMSFSNLAVPAVGGTAMQIRYLQRRGVNLASAIAAGGLLSTLANLVTQVGLLALALWLAPNAVTVANIPTSGLASVALIIAGVIGVLAAVVLGIPRLRRVIVPPVKQAVESMWMAIRSPRRVAMLILGNVLAAGIAVACLFACLKAFGAPAISFWTLMALNISIGTIASLVPIPGGGTAVSSVGMTGALVALGVHDQVAIAAILTNQIVLNYLPAIPGWLATQHLIKHDYL